MYQFTDIGLFRMSRRHKRQTSDKVIHIRIDEVTHQKLKMEAAASRTTIQDIVESMLKGKYATGK